MDDPYDLQRFVIAQDAVYRQVTAELAAGHKTSHWMWFIFPQLEGLGRSATARHYGIASKEEAQAYWSHPVLGARLKECCEQVRSINGKTAEQLFGAVDALKFRSCLTLFEQAAPHEALFGSLLAKYYGGKRDAATLELL
jgi:uncharacterized protein (DUF1810 family)